MRWWCLAIAFSVFIPCVVAQGSKPTPDRGLPPRSVEARVARLDARLALSPAQEKKVIALTRARDAKVSAIAKDRMISDADRLFRVKQVDRSLQASIRALLMPWQKKIWDRMVQEAGSAPNGARRAS